MAYHCREFREACQEALGEEIVYLVRLHEVKAKDVPKGDISLSFDFLQYLFSPYQILISFGAADHLNLAVHHH